MNPYELKGRALFVFSDPGGAKPILTLVDENIGTLTAVKVVSNRTYPFYNDFLTNVDTPDLISNIYDFKPDFIFTGTSYTSDIEIKYIKAAKENGIPIYSFVDHWTNILNRFSNGKEIIFPDIIFVLDERAKQIAIKEGIEIKKLSILPNPYHTFLRKWHPRDNKNSFLNNNKIPADNLLIVFAPDPLSNVGGVEKFDTDEKIISQKFLKVLIKIKSTKKITVIFKPHPNQNIDYIFPVINDLGLNVLCLKDIDTRSLLYYSDIVVGLFSNILIEGQILGKDVIRFLEKSNTDPLEQSNIGTVCRTNDQLLNILQNKINKFNE
jgi:hypothetical protein